ncbi:UDP-sugar pyrophosphorylase-like isoform X2 [Hordeum vulgare subsp. vulgare]|uniref:UDP-sugar pyrophosphorylase-like isoform X2 n=1 Tax=Hordeum vulgare subsp. vulgare TaxID=112509 RepID=UPI001D1A38F6|nr:UDP-sugar pyrophosphorylase-like isoform X2 [Hordeum vulgare subsp. vulgare]
MTSTRSRQSHMGMEMFILFFIQVDYLSNGRTMVINVEYNQLDPLLRATGHPDGDANCETGYSPYPGNINQAAPASRMDCGGC